MKKFLIIAAGVAALAVPSTAGAADYGPATCLNGYVWRQAYSGDTVCVTPATRSRAAQDNAAASSRRDADAGYGPYGCQSGYVWRTARASDLVCVTPNIRDQVKADNAAAASRRNSMALSLTPTDNQQEVHMAGINTGTATVGLYFNNGNVIKIWKVTGNSNRWKFDTGKTVCHGSSNAFFQVKDPTSGRWSNRASISYCVGL